MKKMNLLLIISMLFPLIMGLILVTSSGKKEVIFPVSVESSEDAVTVHNEIELLYYEMQLAEKVNYDAFYQGVTGFNRIEAKNKEILALVDFSKPSTEERLFIFDLEKKELLFKTHVSHGRNSGEKYATSFSNINGSYQSSLGFYLTEHTYQGKNGYSLVLEGLESGINDRAKERAIVIHGAPYSNPSVIASNGRLGRSLGCPAIPEALTRPVIDTLKEGAVLYIFANHSDYLQNSPILG